MLKFKKYQGEIFGLSRSDSGTTLEKKFGEIFS